MSTSSQSIEISSAAEQVPAWKQEVNARLHAHRNRRTRTPENQPALPGLESAEENDSRASRVAARVAERYSKAPSYGEMLAAEAANAARAAEAAAQAAQEAHASAQAILAGLDIEMSEAPAEAAKMSIEMREPEPVRYHVSRESLPPAPVPEPRVSENRLAITEIADETIDLLEASTVVPTQPLPAKLIAFPRELVAPRKARPRLAEGPLRDAEGEPEKSQLRIFEVESDAISKEPVVEAVLPEWHAIRLDDAPKASEPQPKRYPSQPPSSLFELPLHVAPLEDRLMAAAVDVALVLTAFLLFVLVFVACTAHPPAGKPALIGASIALSALCVLYQWLFFSYADGTPGMRYARIALCTFDDENPTRTAMRGRIAALMLSALPLGLGFLWAFFDEDHLGWHDRITRTYQRSYR